MYNYEATVEIVNLISASTGNGVIETITKMQQSASEKGYDDLLECLCKYKSFILFGD